MKQKREREEPCDVCGHYHDVRKQRGCPQAPSRRRPASFRRSPRRAASHPRPAQPCVQYHGGEPCAICGHHLEAPPGAPAAATPPPKPPSAFPSEVVPGFLFLGSYDHASRHEILKALGVGNILNVRWRAGAGFAVGSGALAG